MLNFLVKLARTSSKNNKMEPEMATYRHPKPKCRSLVCLSIIATLFFAVGVFQTFLGIFYARAASRNPILILGPVFAGFGLLLYFALVQLCLIKFRKQKVCDRPPCDALQEEAYPEQLLAHDLQHMKNGFPPIYMLTQDELVMLGPDEMKMMLKNYESTQTATVPPTAPELEAPSNDQTSSCAKDPDEGKEAEPAEDAASEDKSEDTKEKDENPEDLLALLSEVKGVALTEGDHPPSTT